MALSTNIQCDGCPQRVQGNTLKAARREASRLGWTMERGGKGKKSHDWCPSCSEGLRAMRNDNPDKDEKLRRFVWLLKWACRPGTTLFTTNDHDSRKSVSVNFSRVDRLVDTNGAGFRVEIGKDVFAVNVSSTKVL